MMQCNTIDLVVRDVPAATRFFQEIVGLTACEAGERFAELAAGPITLMLTSDAMVPTQPAAGVILHFQVDHVAAALERARSRGAMVLLELTRTDWGWDSAMIAGPKDVVVDFYRPVAP